MNKLIFACFIFCVAWCISADAGPAKPIKKTVTLSDGSTIELTLRGDEYYKFYSGSDGFAYKESMGTYVRMSPDEATKEWTARRARANKENEGRRRALGEPAHLTGHRKGLVLLVQFPDVKFAPKHTQAVFQDYFNKENYTGYGMAGSVKDYFLAQSYGQFEADFDVVGPLTAENIRAYYGRNEENARDVHVRDLVREACLQADPLVDFSDYDWDGDGEVDQVYIVYAGYSESKSGNPETIWPHQGYLSGTNIYLTLDGVEIDRYACSSELTGAAGTELDGIGTFCHEYSHCLGLMDTYDTSYSGGYGMTKWDLMAEGTLNNDSKTPAGYTSYERMFFGWLTPTELKGDISQVSDMKALVDAPEAYILYNEAYRDEYYLLENRQQRGFDSALPGHGLLVLHVDYNKYAWMWNEINTDPSHQRLTVIPADNNFVSSTAGIAGDAFPGTTNNTALTNNSTPASTLYHADADGGKLMNKPIDGITEDEDGLISFWCGRPQMASPDPDDGVAVGDGSSFKISWPEVEGAKYYQVEVTEMGVVPANVEDALEHEFDFHEFVTDEIGTKDISGSFPDYEWWGWFGQNLYTSPNGLLIRGNTNATDGFLGTYVWNMPKSGELTLVLGAAPVGNKAVSSDVYFCYYDSTATSDQAEYVRNVFRCAYNGKRVFHFKGDKDLYYFEIVPYEDMYLNYLAVYNGTWSEEELGLTGANARAARRTLSTPVIYDTDTNSFTYTRVNKDCKYRYLVRAMGENGVCSAWSKEKFYQLGSTGITDILLHPAPQSQAIYTLHGRYVGTDASVLPRGVYIMGGKKIVKLR